MNRKTFGKYLQRERKKPGKSWSATVCKVFNNGLQKTLSAVVRELRQLEQ